LGLGVAQKHRSSGAIAAKPQALRGYRSDGIAQLVFKFVLFTGCMLGFPSCDIGNRDAPASEPLRVVAIEPHAAQGLDCENGACGFDPNAPIRLKFDRWLLPTTAVRQSVSLYTQGTQLGVFLRPDYDVTARSLSYRPDTPLAPGTVYILEIGDADKVPGGFGFRSFDGNALGSTTTFAFRTSQSVQTPPPADALPAAPACDRVVAALASAGCTRGGCHSGNSPTMGLLLESPSGLVSTAIDHVARETETGTDVTEQVVSGGRFGTQMPIIDGGRPENSYLIYKLLIGKWLNRELAARPTAPFAANALSQDAIDRARAWFIEFGAMPPDEIGYPEGVSPLELVSELQSWIRAGASCP